MTQAADKIKILIVEDNPISGEDFRRRIIALGYDVIGPLTKGEEVFGAASAARPDLILMDIMLKGHMNGIEASKEINRHMDIPIIYLTAHADPATIERAKKTKPYGYVVKPFDDNELKSAIEIAIYKQRSDRKVKESRRWLETTLKSIGDGVIATDDKGDLVFMNSVAEHLTGCKEADVIGTPVNDVFHIISELTGMVEPNPIARVLKDEIVVGLSNHTLLVNKQGQRIPISDSGSPIKNDDGEVIGVVLVFRDQTEERNAQKALKKSESLKNAIIEGSPDCIKLLDIDGNLKFINKSGQEKIEIKDIQHYLNTVWTNFWKDEDNIKAKKAVAAAVNGNTGQFQGYLPTETGKPKWWDVIISPLYGDAGTVKQLLVVSRDITDQKKMETDLIQSQKMESIGTLAGGIAHDFNNLLSSIIGFTELALDEVEKDTTIEDNLQEVYTAGKRAKDLVWQILTFARKADEPVKPISIDTIAKEVIKFIRSSIPSTIEIKQEIMSNSLIMGNPTQIHQIFLNLCTNAAQAMEDEGGVLEVSLKDIELDMDAGKKLGLKDGIYMEIAVIDTGIGIPPHVIDSIFEPYFTTKEPGEGTGMGLAMVQGIVESYGGKITVDSTLGQGAIFKIYFPITRKRKIQHQYEPKQLPSGNERILFVDDEAQIAKMSSQGLERLGYQVTTRTSSVEALELFQVKPDEFDLVVTDMTMPNMTGDELAIELMKIRPDIPVILCTGYSKKISEEAASKIGIMAFAYKPMVKADLARIVRKVLDKTKS